MNVPAEKFDQIGIGSVTDELKPGTRLLGGQFTIDSFLNAGGFGITYLARDSLDRRVVVKECFPSSFCRRAGTTVAPRTRQREDDFRSVVRLFVQEALTLSRLQHDNIVKVFQVFEDNDTAYMAMEYIDGPDLLETVEGTAPALSPEQIRTILEQMLDAVGHVHQQGVLHRDISPDNILLDRNTGRPVLIDFGASRKDVTRKSRALSGLRVVKDGYSPQEFYIGGSLQGPNSDLYALAATFCHLATGTTPKTSQERLSAIASRQGDPQPPVMGRAKGYPVEFLKAIDKGMSIFPRDRFQSVAEWQAALRSDVRRPTLSAVQGPSPSHVLPAVPVHVRSASPVLASVPVMAPIPAPAATLAAVVPVEARHVSPAASLAEMPDPTDAVRAAIAAAAIDDAAVTAAPAKAASARSKPASSSPAPASARSSVSAAVAAAMPEPAASTSAHPAAHPVSAGKPARRALRPLLAASAAAVLLVVGLGSLPAFLDRANGTATASLATTGAALMAASPVELVNGIVLHTVETAQGARAMVSVLPEGVSTDLQVGDFLLVYAATGEMIESAEAVQTLLLRESENGVATFGFAVQRDGKMAVGFFGLPDLRKADLDVKDQDLENKT
jgi:serine/threonine protein kinase